MKRTRFLTIICLLLTCSSIAALTGCQNIQSNQSSGNIKNITANSEKTIQAINLMENLPVSEITTKPLDPDFTQAHMKLAVSLFQKCYYTDANTLISPLSITMALAMTANGADGETLSEMEALLGDGMSIEDLNAYLASYRNGLVSSDKSQLQLANSIWFRGDNSTIEQSDMNPDFLQVNADYYQASAFQAPFDEQTADDINSWVSNNTNGMIEKLIDKIDAETILYLINTLAFEAEWENPYDEYSIRDSDFTAIDGTVSNVTMMYSTENHYLEDEFVTGFVKDYKNGDYSFAALLPHEGIDISDYMEELTPQYLSALLNSSRETSVQTGTPKFTSEYEASLNDILIELGIPTAFEPGKADFSKMKKSSDSSLKNSLYISEVLHKTYISVDEKGTKAAAATSVAVKECAAIDEKMVILNRPFVYFIIDNNSGLPIFMGTVVDLAE